MSCTDDESYIKAAEFKAALFDTLDRISFSSTDKSTTIVAKNVVNVPQKKSSGLQFRQAFKVFDRADSNPLTVYCVETSDLEKYINERRTTQPNMFSAFFRDTYLNCVTSSARRSIHCGELH